MKTAGQTARRLSILSAAAALVLAVVVPASADTLTVASGSAKPLDLPNVRVTKIEGGILTYEATGGTARQRALADVKKMNIVGETALNNAEDAFEKGDFKTAADNYKRTIEGSQKPFVKARAISRLSEAAAKTGDFGLAVSAWAQQVPTLDVATAMKTKPAPPAGTKPEVLNSAAGEVERIAGNAKISPEQKSMALTYAVEIYQAAGNTAASAALLAKLTGGAAPAAPVGPATPAVGAGNPAATTVKPTTPGLSGDIVLVQAKQAAGARDYAKVIAVIEANKAGIVTPENQAEALYMLATSKEAIAGTDPAKLQDAAIAYMRVVAHFEGRNVQTANVPAALWKVGDIQQRLKNNVEALQIFNQLAGDPKLAGTPIQAEAVKRVAALKAGK